MKIPKLNEIGRGGISIDDLQAIHLLTVNTRAGIFRGANEIIFTQSRRLSVSPINTGGTPSKLRYYVR